MHAIAFLQRVQADSVPPVLLLVGEETLLAEEIVRRLCRLIEGGESTGGCVDRFDGAESGLPAVIDAASTGSLFAARRIVAVTGAENLSAPVGSPELEMLRKYLEDPSPQVVLVFVAQSVKRNQQPFKALVKKAEVVECEPLRGPALHGWIAARLRERGFAAAPGVAERVEELLGRDLRTIRNSVEKVMLYCAERKRVEIADLHAVLGVLREHTVWELTDALARRDAGASLTLLSRLLDEAKAPEMIIGALRFQYRQLLILKDLMQRGAPQRQLAERAGIKFRFDRAAAQAKAFRLAELHDIYKSLFDLENSIKSAAVEARWLFERLVLQICGAAETAAAGELL